MKLSNDFLTVDIMEPGSEYKGQRYDYTGWIKQINFKGVDLCTTESAAPDVEMLNGSGLCSEFGIFAPVGYDDCKPGQQFPKLGVGLLTKADEGPYEFSKPFKMEPFEIKSHSNEVSAFFEVLPSPCRGYEAGIKKQIIINGSTLVIDYELINTGTMTIQTHEYCHNYLSFQQSAFNSDYQLKLPFNVKAETLPKPGIYKDDYITWPEEDFDTYYTRPEGYKPEQIVWWELFHTKTGVRMREQLNAPLLWMALFGTKRLVSAELFIPINVKPGETQKWKRTYTFSRD
jgi:hypothetical protein